MSYIIYERFLVLVQSSAIFMFGVLKLFGVLELEMSTVNWYLYSITPSIILWDHALFVKAWYDTCIVLPLYYTCNKARKVYMCRLKKIQHLSATSLHRLFYNSHATRKL